MWDKMVKTHIITTAKRLTKLPFNRNRKVLFSDEFIVVNDAGKTKVFSAHCTHLGCLINQSEGAKLLCPCHGSEFSLNGMAVKGPAYKPLKKEKFYFGEKKDFIFLR